MDIIINSLLKTGNKTANINVKTAVYRPTHFWRRRIENRKYYKKGNVNHTNIDIQAMLV